MKFELNTNRNPLNMLDIFNPNVFEDIFNEKQINEKPKADIIEKEDSYTIRMALPGLSKKDIKIDLSDNKLTISGSFDEEELAENEQFLSREIYGGTFLRSFDLGFSINQTNISASFNNGLLSIKLPKSEKALKRNIDIK